ncbi:hypothetical protein AWB67_07553 [Caballeronia terrestris]|uniref:Uncharacterized protein n=1 Tax=Caballeronia terrestris TaxID=1226301 RepID=A0A158L5D7_9BURK|nr:hypothetical protein AWB67_07553 [Caballeronia terrestris]
MAVPVHHRDGGAVLRAELREAAGQARDALAERAVGHALVATVDDLLIGRLGERCVQQMLDQQRIGISRWH